MLSFIIAVFASYSALNLAAKISRSRGRTQKWWLVAGSCVMGSGVWSMHFVGMLAFHLNVPVNYDIPITLLSMLCSIVASFIAFQMLLSKGVNWGKFALSGFCMGSGIVAMHSTGMAAMRLPAEIIYDRSYWLLSAAIALAASYVALLLFLRFRDHTEVSWWKWVSALIMGLAICGMHFTGMKAADFWCGNPNAIISTDAGEMNLLLLAGVTITTFFILMVSWGAMFFDRHVLEKMAYSDPLTGLPNRHDLNRLLGEGVDTSKETAVLFIDLDRFKTINDTLGHDIGDMLVQEVGRRLSGYLQDDQKVFRLGGDEFLVVAENCGQALAEELASGILEVVTRPFVLQGNELYITASIGISLAPKHGTDRASLLKTSDTAMYNAKNAGKNRYCVFDDDMDKRLLRRLELEKDMRGASERQEFYVVYQPKWDAQTDTPVGLEALMRWPHPKFGVVSPDEFIPIAEETGLIIPMTRWILEEACRQNKVWLDKGMPSMIVSVNVSVRLFESQHLLYMVEHALRTTGLPARYLELEITESTMLYDVPDMIRQLNELREIGVRISMDDFGSGYSSLGSLDQIPIDTIKIDQLFVRESDSPSKRAIVGAIIDMALKLHLELVAEGVETREQIDFLRASGCNVMQGYFYGKPMNIEQMDEWLLQNAGRPSGETLV
ncbi:putative signaling protein [Paenibacillus cineris]|uniref:Signaling protein n=2 Tax=Paenibacillus cineris TaxID=237530 RepID=A0ABQ4LLP2_9BACL|nr:bifunctional diguanylate cyclase/phosphodiesterase [Paenibacillus cineris]GIO57427.1 putative signaling protein [Paenibacillus cineris]GIO63198.1 putative signaling protein [Paenibacillus cineris]